MYESVEKVQKGEEYIKADQGNRIYLFFKRAIDIFGSGFGLIILSPVFLIVAIAIKIEDHKGSILFSQKRVGQYGKEFNMYKFRSMVSNAEELKAKLMAQNEMSGPMFKMKHDPRITKVGKFIRKTRIDEIPQLFNILKGDMGLIGPRPERPNFTVQFNEEIPGFINRLAIKPGLTGWAQVNGGYEITPEEKLKEDIYYIKNRSILLDFKILFKTVKVVLTGDGAR